MADIKRAVEWMQLYHSVRRPKFGNGWFSLNSAGELEGIDANRPGEADYLHLRAVDILANDWEIAE